MIRAFIQINLSTGGSITYVNQTVADSNGLDGKYYGYTNEPGDKYEDQTGAGKIRGDFEAIRADIIGAGQWLELPGETISFTRKNRDQSKKTESRVLTSFLKDKIVSVSVVEKELSEWEEVYIARGFAK